MNEGSGPDPRPAESGPSRRLLKPPQVTLFPARARELPSGPRRAVTDTTARELLVVRAQVSPFLFFVFCFGFSHCLGDWPAALLTRRCLRASLCNMQRPEQHEHRLGAWELASTRACAPLTPGCWPRCAFPSTRLPGPRRPATRRLPAPSVEGSAAVRPPFRSPATGQRAVYSGFCPGSIGEAGLDREEEVGTGGAAAHQAPAWLGEAQGCAHGNRQVCWSLADA